jgi:hypothetical protein
MERTVLLGEALAAFTALQHAVRELTQDGHVARADTVRDLRHHADLQGRADLEQLAQARALRRDRIGQVVHDRVEGEVRHENAFAVPGVDDAQRLQRLEPLAQRRARHAQLLAQRGFRGQRIAAGQLVRLDVALHFGGCELVGGLAAGGFHGVSGFGNRGGQMSDKW